MAGAGSAEWVTEPNLPPGGSLEVLSAHYLPDPKPPADSQTVEGRHKKQEVGLIQEHLQRLHREHAEFGALRIVVRNNGRTPTRIARPILLGGKPIQESYVDFETSAWDARGVVWYRARPRLLQPGQCGQIYVRFRRRPEGNGAAVTIPLENGPPVPVEIPYQAPTHSVDYVTTPAAWPTTAGGNSSSGLRLGPQLGWSSTAPPGP